MSLGTDARLLGLRRAALLNPAVMGQLRRVEQRAGVCISWPPLPGGKGRRCEQPGYGDGDGDGYGNGYGNGDGDGYGNGDGNGDGDGDGDGDGYGYPRGACD